MDQGFSPPPLTGEVITQNVSPVAPPRSPEAHMSFPAAMHEIIKKHRITKREWNDPNTYCLLKDGVLMINLKDGLHQWVISEADMMGTDWQPL
jgi:hypothetical protein